MKEQEYSHIYNYAFDKLMKTEGGYVNDPSDKGGETKYGISKRSYPELNIALLTKEDAKKIYYDDYWLKNNCHLIINILDSIKIFDMSVNFGVTKAMKIVQRAVKCFGLELIEDGIAGKNTSEVINMLNYNCLYIILRVECASEYRVIVKSNPSQERFLVGWLKRAYE